MTMEKHAYGRTDETYFPYRDLAAGYCREGKYELAVKTLADYLKATPRRDDEYIRNIVTNRMEYLGRKVVLESKPLTLNAVLTTKCNLRCRMCDTCGEFELSAKTVDEIIALLPYARFAQWLGGEVFLFEHFERLFRKCLEYPGLVQGINTNGLLVTEKWLDILSDSQSSMSLVFSIDAVTRDTYEHIRRGASFRDLISRLELAARYVEKLGRSRLRVALNFIVMKSNYRELKDIVRFAKRYNVAEIQLNELIKFSPEDVYEEERIDGEALGYIMDVLPDVGKEAASSCIDLDNWLSGTKPAAHLEDKELSSPGHINDFSCRAPWDRLTISNLGYVYPHRFCVEPVGNIRESSIAEIWNSPKMQEYRRRIIEKDIASLCSGICASKMNEDNYFMGIDLMI